MSHEDSFLRLQRISKTFAAEPGEALSTHVIDSVSMDIKAGEFVVFLGPSGCGKTTLMRVVGGLEVPTEGEVLLAGQKIMGPDRKKGMVFEAYTSFPWLTVIQNIKILLPTASNPKCEKRRRINVYFVGTVTLTPYPILLISTFRLSHSKPPRELSACKLI